MLIKPRQWHEDYPLLSPSCLSSDVEDLGCKAGGRRILISIRSMPVTVPAVKLSMPLVPQQ